jgi:hypothetical protein
VERKSTKGEKNKVPPQKMHQILTLLAHTQIAREACEPSIVALASKQKGTAHCKILTHPIAPSVVFNTTHHAPTTERTMASTSAAAWAGLKAAVAKHPWLGVVVALLVPLLGAAAVFLAPFAILLGIGGVAFVKFGPKSEVRRTQHETHAHAHAHTRAHASSVNNVMYTASRQAHDASPRFARQKNKNMQVEWLCQSGAIWRCRLLGRSAHRDAKHSPPVLPFNNVHQADADASSSAAAAPTKSVAAATTAAAPAAPAAAAVATTEPAAAAAAAAPKPAARAAPAAATNGATPPLTGSAALMAKMRKSGAVSGGGRCNVELCMPHSPKATGFKPFTVPSNTSILNSNRAFQSQPCVRYAAARSARSTPPPSPPPRKPRPRWGAVQLENPAYP